MKVSRAATATATATATVVALREMTVECGVWTRTDVLHVGRRRRRIGGRVPGDGRGGKLGETEE